MKKSMFAIALITLSMCCVPLAGSGYAAAVEAPVTPEVSAPGDIPDSQAFIVFKSPAGFSIKVPEGWSRKDDNDGATFNDKYNLISLTYGLSDMPVDMAYAKSALVPDLEHTERAVKVTKIEEVPLRSGKTVKISYDSNSEPNAVTNKQVREENERLYFVKSGKLVVLQLSAPKGADNVDQWKLISTSFKWN
ncbi:MAG: hypothetical protein ABI230_08630 [Aestuariivirga sp.]